MREIRFLHVDSQQWISAQRARNAISLKTSCLTKVEYLVIFWDAMTLCDIIVIVSDTYFAHTDILHVFSVTFQGQVEQVTLIPDSDAYIKQCEGHSATIVSATVFQPFPNIQTIKSQYHVFWCFAYGWNQGPVSIHMPSFQAYRFPFWQWNSQTTVFSL